MLVLLETLCVIFETYIFLVLFVHCEFVIAYVLHCVSFRRIGLLVGKEAPALVDLALLVLLQLRHQMLLAHRFSLSTA